MRQTFEVWQTSKVLFTTFLGTCGSSNKYVGFVSPLGGHVKTDTILRRDSIRKMVGRKPSNMKGCHFEQGSRNLLVINMLIFFLSRLKFLRAKTSTEKSK
jgi:hypothetical protein